MKQPGISIVILTYNEEANLAAALDSVCGWARDVFVVDSFSRDRTLEVAGRYDCQVFQNEFTDFAQQFNWALGSLPIRSEWIFFLDADERIPPELQAEIDAVIRSAPAANGYSLRMLFVWMSAPVRRGYSSRWFMRLVRNGRARWEQRKINPHLLVEGETGRLRHRFVHDNRKGLRDWSEKHVAYALHEARQLLIAQDDAGYMEPRLFGSPQQRVRWIRANVYNRMPPLVRPFCYFFYRVVIRGGLLDGWRALIFHFLHAFWCPLLIDLFYLELRNREPSFRNRERNQPAVTSEPRA